MPDEPKPSLEEIAQVVRRVVERELRRSRQGSELKQQQEQKPRRAQGSSPSVLITEDMVMSCHRQKRDLVLPPKYIMTPLAKDALNKFNVKTVTHEELDKNESEKMKSSVETVVIWADRFSHDLKNQLMERISGDFTIQDMSADGDLRNLITAVQNSSKTRGIAISEAGVELSILLNKYPGIRAVFAENAEPVVVGRERVSANTLTISSDQTSLNRAVDMAQRFIHTEFKNPQFKQLIEEILNAEKQR